MKPLHLHGVLILVCSCCMFGDFQDIVTSLQAQKHLLKTGYNLCSDGVASLGHYNGTISVTESGADCLNWSEFPDYMQQYPSRGLGNHNYCRNPEGGRTPWCFYRQPSGIISWAHCDCSHGAIRLLGDQPNKSGGVQLYLHGVWGSVCADHWTDWDASVVCRQLGISEIGIGRKISDYGLWNTPVHLKSANCRGDENALLHCSYSQGKDCRHRMVAAVTCSPPQEQV